MEVKINIRFKFYHPPENEEIAYIDSIELSPHTFDHRVKYGLSGLKGEFDFIELVKGSSLRYQTSMILCSQSFSPRRFSRFCFANS